MEHLEQPKLRGLRAFFAWGSYPLVIALGMGFALWMANSIPDTQGDSLFNIALFGMEWTLYENKLYQYTMYLLPVLFSGLWVYTMERLQPFALSWRPDWKTNIWSDVGLFILNNVLLRAEFFVALVMATFAGTLSNWLGFEIWPHHWPLIFQVALFLVIAEFMTYWLHRLEHESFFFWRIHCVHHNPKKLYWLNATRFHYIDIIALPVLANLPAVAMGADSLVIYLATTFSVMHGFWQHGNVNVRFGWLNYLVSSPELHRWHHMKDTKLANHNYGSNLIIWDLVFGTWFLPKRPLNPNDVGVHNMEGDGIIKQLALPFTLKT